MRHRLVSAGCILGLILGALALPMGAAWGQEPIRIGEINSYTGIGAPFTLPYKQGIELALEEVNARGGVLGRKLQVIYRDDKGNPAEAVKHAQELVTGERVHLLAGTFLSNVGLAVSDFARQNKTLFVAAEPLTEALTWSKGHRYVFRVRPNVHSQGRMLADRAAKLPYKKWAVIGPDFEYGHRAWETFLGQMKQQKPDLTVVGEHWPKLGRIEPGPFVTALLNQQPEAVFVSLFGSDWIAFVREATKRGLFGKAFFVGILLGEPEYIDPLKLEAPEGMLVTGYPWYADERPSHKAFVATYTKRYGTHPVTGSLVGYITLHSIAEAVRRAGATDTEKMVDAFRGLRLATPVGDVSYRPFDGQATMGAWVGTTKLDRQRGVGVMVDWEYVPGEKVLPSEAEVNQMRQAAR